MNFKYLFNIYGLIFICLLTSCREIPIKLDDPVIPASDRIVLIEDLSGVSCPNCPKGNVSIANIVTKFSGRVANVAIHGDFLSKPTAKSKYDFRNPKAKDLETWFKPWFGKPSASINRVPDENGLLMNPLPDLWQAAVEKELQKPHLMNIILGTKYDPTSRKLDIDIAAIPLTDLGGSFNISLYLTESGIKDAQTDGANIIEDYIHNHILRDMMTKFDGDYFGADLKKNAIYNKTYTYNLPQPTNGLWDPSRIELIVSIHHNEVKDKSVVQAVYKKIF